MTTDLKILYCIAFFVFVGPKLLEHVKTWRAEQLAEMAHAKSLLDAEKEGWALAVNNPQFLDPEEVKTQHELCTTLDLNDPNEKEEVLAVVKGWCGALQSIYDQRITSR